jgi:hypothetical protein
MSGGTVAEAEHARSADAVICVDGLVDEHEELAAHLEQDDTDPQLEQLVPQHRSRLEVSNCGYRVAPNEMKIPG